MFNLLIALEPDSWDSSPYECSRHRAFREFTASEITERYKSFDEAAIGELKRFPTLFVTENESVESRIGYITNIKLRTNSIVIDFEFHPTLPSLPIGAIEKMGKDIDLGGSELSRTHWAVKDEQIFEILLRHGYVNSKQIEAVRQQRPPASSSAAIGFPKDVEDLLEIIIEGLPRAMFPLKNSRLGASAMCFDNEYDVQSLFHALLCPWIKDIRPEEFTPSYAGKSTRVDFLCPQYKIVIEIKFVRDKQHAKKIGDELIIDIAKYRVHPDCQQLWIVIFDPKGLLPNPDGLKGDLDGPHESGNKRIEVKTFVRTL